MVKCLDLCAGEKSTVVHYRRCLLYHRRHIKSRPVAESLTTQPGVFNYEEGECANAN